MTRRPRVVALGGGHGLTASLGALRRLTPHVTAVVTVADDGGSSGRLRADMPWLLPPGDLRMALCALAAEDADSQAWAGLLQQRFAGGTLDGHPVGNLLLAGLLQQEDGPEQALRRLGALVGAVGAVLPLSVAPLDIEADVDDLSDDLAEEGGVVAGHADADVDESAVEADEPGHTDAADGATATGVSAAGGGRLVRGQVAVATTSGRVRRVRLIPTDPPVSPQVLAAVRDADCVVLGPGSLFTSQLPHLLTPALAAELRRGARIVIVCNLVPQPGETDGLDAAGHLHALIRQVPWLHAAVVVADNHAVPTGSAALTRLTGAAAQLGASVVTAPLSADGQPGVHDVRRLAGVLGTLLVGAPGSPPDPGVRPGSGLRQDGAVPAGAGTGWTGGRAAFRAAPGEARGSEAKGERAWWQ